jgi:tRNA pseudouridine55 synthase
MSQPFRKPQRPEPEQEPGEVLLIDKPLRWTSFDVVKKVKYALKPRKIGHAGTLDPLATGLLILCTGKKTKTIDQIQAQEKEYTGIFRLGQTTPSFDLETPVDAERPWQHLTREDLLAAAAKLTGRIEQTPPLFSAVKINGERAYEVARRGDTAEIKSKTVDINAFELPQIDGPNVHFRIVCSKGTYVRSLARDFGELLGCGAHLTQLVRTRIGEYRLENALSMADIEARRPPRPEGEAERPRRERTPRPERRLGLEHYDATQQPTTGEPTTGEPAE